MSSTRQKVIIMAAPLAVGLLAGGAIGYMNSKDDGMHNEESAMVTSAPDTTTKAAGLRTLLNNLEAEHVDLAAAATRAGFDGDASFPAAAAALDKNSNELADTIGSVYGAEARTKFYEIWNSHIGFFVDYTVAAKSGDMAGMEKAVQNLGGYVDAISDFLSSANPNLPREAVATLVSEHVTLLKTAVDKHGSGDFAGSYEAQAQAREQITTKIADTLAGAIVKQNESQF